LWRQDEDRRRVKTIVGAFAERPKLPKMLRRKDLLDTMSNGCIQGLYVLSLPRPDGTARTWWRMLIDESGLNDDALEAVQNSAAALESLDPSLLAPGKLEGLDWKNGLKVADLVTYFDGHTVTIDHPDEGWTEEKPIPRCSEAKVLEAVSATVKAGTIWLISDRLREAGLVTVRREGRSMIYAARFETMNALLGFLTENCCGGAPAKCAPAVVCKPGRTARAKAMT
jgi:hypothetical protein